ncbi:MAG: AAA family ATPase [Bacteroidales bacterium]|nr:AAA family ATPase [Bacteroidales bacterium]
MVKVVGKIDIEKGINGKVNSFRIKIIEILNKHKTKTFPLGRILHEISSIKNDVKKAFPKYNIPPKDRRNENDKFDWHHFFEENLAPEFEIEKDVRNNGETTDILHYYPEKGAKQEKIIENNITEPKPIETIIKPEDSSSNSKLENTKEPKQIDGTNIEKQEVEEKQYQIMTQEKVNNVLKELIGELNEGLYEKERSIRLTLLAVLAGESTFMLGEPGTAKSLVARRISEAFEEPKDESEIKFFDYLMNQFSTPEEIFGPVSIEGLKNDNYVRKTEKYLPKAQFAFLDEIWKANPAIQNALLTILNERIFKNGANIENVPLIGFMSASNELPEKGKGLEAIFDRFLVRILEKPISDTDNFRSMISAGRNMQVSISHKLTKEIVNQIINDSEIVDISDECFDVMQSVRKAITDKNKSIKDESEKYIISDRRWKKIANLMRVSAYCNNRDKTDLMDASLIADCIWSTEKQESEASQIVADAIKKYGIKCKSDVNLLKDEVSGFEIDIDESFYNETTDTEEKIVQVKGRKYYEVISNTRNPETHYIACNSHRDYYDNYKYYYFLPDLKSDQREICASYNDSTKTYTEYYNNGRKYEVQMEETEPYLVKRTDFSEKVRIASVERFEKNADNIKANIENAIKQIEHEIESLKDQMKNLFANTDYYSDILFKEHISFKSKLTKLLDDLDKQRKRYL